MHEVGGVVIAAQREAEVTCPWRTRGFPACPLFSREARKNSCAGDLDRVIRPDRVKADDLAGEPLRGAEIQRAAPAGERNRLAAATVESNSSVEAPEILSDPVPVTVPRTSSVAAVSSIVAVIASSAGILSPSVTFPPRWLTVSASFQGGGIRFRLWAPREKRVGLGIDGRDDPVAMTPAANELFRGLRERLARGRTLFAVEKNDVARFGLLFAQLQAQAHTFHLAFRLTSFQRVPGPPPAELFFRKALDSCERLMRTPSRASISARRRGIVQLRRSATGSSSKGAATRKAASLFTGGGPGAMLVFSAATPRAAKSLRHSRTVSSRTLNASAILGLVQPASVKSTARARSASPRSREPASAARAARCSSLAKTGDFPAMPHALQIDGGSESQKTYPLVNHTESA